MLHVLWTSVQETLGDPGFIAASARDLTLYIFVSAICRVSPEDSCLRMVSDFPLHPPLQLFSSMCPFESLVKPTDHFSGKLKGEVHSRTENDGPEGE